MNQEEMNQAVEEREKYNKVLLEQLIQNQNKDSLRILELELKVKDLVHLMACCSRVIVKNFENELEK